MKKFLFSLALLPVLTVPAFAVTVFNSDGSLRYSDDPSVTATVNGAVSEFLTKPFEEYTVTEGFQLIHPEYRKVSAPVPAAGRVCVPLEDHKGGV